MRRKPVPSCRLHRASGQARTIIDGHHVYLGKFNSPESRRLYARLLAEMSLPGHSFTPTTESAPPSSQMVAEVLVKYLDYAEYYYAEDGNSGREFQAMIDAIAPVNELYGELIANVFGPQKLKTIRQKLIARDLCRKEVNKGSGESTGFSNGQSARSW